MGSYPTIAIFFSFFFFFILNFFNANKLCNDYVMMQICVLGPNELRMATYRDGVKRRGDEIGMGL